LENGLGGGEETIGSMGEALLGDQLCWEAAVALLEGGPDGILVSAQGFQKRRQGFWFQEVDLYSMTQGAYGVTVWIVGEQVGPAALTGPVAGVLGIIASMEEVNIFNFGCFGFAGWAAEDAGRFDGVEELAIVG